MPEALLNHPADEALLALSLGQLAEAELADVSAHLGGCPGCCHRIDQLADDDRLLTRLRQNAACREEVLVSPAQRRAAVRALRQDRSARRRTGSERGTVSEIAQAAAVDTDLDTTPSRDLAADLTRFLGPPEQPDELGRLGPYRILAVLGKGGMGVVFRAHDPALDRPVALKAMLPGLAALPTARDRFLREAKAAAALKHPHVVAIYQVGEDRGAPFLAMEFLEGEPLDNRIRREGRLPLAEALRIGREIALGLAAAHARGLVHRDIKPANLWLEGPAGHVKILDFGLARAKADPAPLTHSGLIVGTPAYMAPEQAAGKPADPRCDLFSLGCVLYQMCTGAAPFHGDSTMAVLSALALHEPPPVGALRPDAPPELSGLVSRLLTKKPEGRPTSAEEVAQTLHALEQLPAAKPLPNPGARPPRKGRRPLVAVTGAALAVVLALVLILWPTPRGTVRIECDDPAVEVVFDKDGPTIKGADREPITLRAGEHGVLIRRGDFTFETDRLVLKKGAALTLKVELLQGKVEVVQNGGVVTTQRLPLAAAPPLARVPFDAWQAREHQKAWAKYLGVPVEYTNKLGMKFRLIPPGEFTMGVPETDVEGWAGFDLYRNDGKVAVPAHLVRLTRPFYIGEGEVRYRDFLDLVKHEPGGRPKHPSNEPDGVLRESCTWFDCIEFCNRLSEREGLTPAYHVQGQEVAVIPGATGYRLPTEAEWEFACRAGTTSLWYFGWTTREAQAMCARRVGEAEAYLRTRTTSTNPFGLVGLYAGASEWCWDWYDSAYYRRCADRGVVVDPQGPDLGEERITRGGSCFEHDSGHLTHSNSAGRVPKEPQGPNGFGRVVLPVPLNGPHAAADPAPRPGGNRLDPLAGWLREVAGLPAPEQVKAVADKLKDLNPGFDGKLEPVQLKDGVVTGLGLVVDHVTDISPLRALAGLTDLKCNGSRWGRGQLADLSPLKGLKLTQLSVWSTRVSDLSPLAGMKLRVLSCAGSPVTDLAPLRGMPLEDLDCQQNGKYIKSLAPLQGMPLRRLDISLTDVSDLSPLRGMQLDYLSFTFCPVKDLSPLVGMPLKVLGCKVTRVTDLSPLAGTPLKTLWCDFKAERDAAVLRSIKTLQRVNETSAAELWKEVDAKTGAQQR